MYIESWIMVALAVLLVVYFFALFVWRKVQWGTLKSSFDKINLYADPEGASPHHDFIAFVDQLAKSPWSYDSFYRKAELFSGMSCLEDLDYLQ